MSRRMELFRLASTHPAVKEILAVTRDALQQAATQGCLNTLVNHKPYEKEHLLMAARILKDQDHFKIQYVEVDEPWVVGL